MMKAKPMATPGTRSKWEERFFHIVEGFRNETIMLPPNAINSFARMRYLPNMRVNFLSVNETARLVANQRYDLMRQTEPTVAIDNESTENEI
jgi:hypothetical protein